MRATNGRPRHHRCVVVVARRRRRVRRFVRPWTIQQIPGGGQQKHAPRLYRIWSSYAGAKGFVSDYGLSRMAASRVLARCTHADIWT